MYNKKDGVQIFGQVKANGEKLHVHLKDGTSLNNDGTIHDKHRGTPNPSNKTKKWLEKHGWEW